MTPLVTVGVKCRASLDDGWWLIDVRAPPVFVSTPRVTVTDFSDAFFAYDGLWAMFVTFVPSGQEAAVWSLWMQALMKEIGAEMAITPLPCDKPETTQYAQNAHSQLDSKTFATVNSWTCASGLTFYACATDLAEHLQRHELVNVQLLSLLKVWLKELGKSGMAEPKRLKQIEPPKDLLMGCIIFSPSPVTVPQKHNITGKLFPELERQCSGIPMPPTIADPFKEYPTDINKSKNVRFIEDLHRRHYDVIVYCGPSSNHIIAMYRQRGQPLTFVEVPPTRGFVAYECVSRAMMMNYDVTGYLEMADDVVLNSWTLGAIPRDKFWFQKDLKIESRQTQVMQDFAFPQNPTPWWPWTTEGQKYGAKGMASVWKQFYGIKVAGNYAAKEIVSVFLDILSKNSGNKDNFFYSSSDIFYVPAKHRQAWVLLSEIFFTNHVFLDIAVPTLMNGLDLTSNIVRMDGEYLWYNNRANYAAHYRASHQFFHPWKMGWIKDKKHAGFVCYTVLPNIVKDLIG